MPIVIVKRNYTFLLPFLLISKTFKFQNFILWFPPFIGGFYGYFFPKTITWDSYLYLVSSEKLFTSEFISWYQWLREPFYSFFLKFLNINNQLDLNLLGFTQGFLHALGIALIFYCVYKLNSYRPFLYKPLLLLTLFISVFITINYSTYVLQQSFIIFFIGLFVFSLYSVYNNRGFSRLSFTLNLFLIFLTSTFTILLLPIPLFIMLFGLILSKKVNLTYLLLILVALLSFSLPWNIVKYHAVTSNLSKYPEGMSSFIFLKTDLSVLTSENRFETKIKLSGAGILSTLGISDELSGVTFTGGVAGEHFLFAAPLEISDRPCPLLYPGPDIYVNEFNNSFQNTCYRFQLFKLVETINLFVQIFLPIANLTAFILVTYFVYRRNIIILTIMLPPLLSQVPYWVGGYYGSRYGLPVIALTPLVIFFALMKLYQKVKRRFPQKNNFQSV